MTDHRLTIDLMPHIRTWMDRHGSDRGEAASQACDDLAAYRSLLRRAIGEVAGSISRGEAMLLADVLNIHHYTADNADYYNISLSHEVSDGDRLDGLGRKWDIDGQELAGRIEVMPALHAIAIIDVVKRWWELSDSDRTSNRLYEMLGCGSAMSSDKTDNEPGSDTTKRGHTR